MTYATEEQSWGLFETIKLVGDNLCRATAGIAKPTDLPLYTEWRESVELVRKDPDGTDDLAPMIKASTKLYDLAKEMLGDPTVPKGVRGKLTKAIRGWDGAFPDGPESE